MFTRFLKLELRDGSPIYEGRKERREKYVTTISLIQFSVFMHILLLNFSSLFESNLQKDGSKGTSAPSKTRILFESYVFQQKPVLRKPNLLIVWATLRDTNSEPLFTLEKSYVKPLTISSTVKIFAL